MVNERVGSVGESEIDSILCFFIKQFQTRSISEKVEVCALKRIQDFVRNSRRQSCVCTVSDIGARGPRE